MNELREKLKERYLNIGEYFVEGFNVSKEVVKKETKLVAAQLILAIAQVFAPALSFINIAILLFLIKKVVEVIEDRKTKVEKEIIVKIIKMLGIFYLFSMVFGMIMFMAILFSAGRELLDGIGAYGEDISPYVYFMGNNKWLFISISVIIPGILGIIYLAVLPYFLYIYMARDVYIRQAYNVNKKLRIGNRLRLLVASAPILIVNLITHIFMPDTINIVLSVFVLVIVVLITFYSICVHSLVSLNVEYMYKKNQGEDLYSESYV